jgi:hypothetical protein
MRALLIVCALAATAAAESKSWTAIKGRLPPETHGVATLDAKALRGTPLFAKIYDSYLARYPAIDVAIQAAKALCGIDAATAVTDATAVVASYRKLWVIAFDGVDKAKALDCAKKILAVMERSTVTAKTVGAVTEYAWTSIARGATPKSISVAWIAKDVLVISEYPGKDTYDGIATGKPPEAELAALIAKASAGGVPAWGAMQNPKPDRDGYTGGYLAASAAKGGVTVTGRFLTISAAARGKAFLQLQKEQTRAVERTKSPDLLRVWKAVKLAEAGNDIAIDASATDDDFLAVLPDIDGVL